MKTREFGTKPLRAVAVGKCIEMKKLKIETNTTVTFKSEDERVLWKDVVHHSLDLGASPRRAVRSADSIVAAYKLRSKS